MKRPFSQSEASDVEKRSQVAIVGGGFTGATAALVLAQHGISVTVFDQGRRGPGGRASHRRVLAADHTVLPDDAPPQVHGSSGGSANFEFDHGAQFFRADTKRFRTMVDEWCAKGWAAQWEGHFGLVNVRDEHVSQKVSGEFFGLPSSPPFFVGVGGMQMLPRAVLSEAERTGLVEVCRGVRVQHMERFSAENSSTGPQWHLSGPSGEGAYHDTPEVIAAKTKAASLGSFDTVLVTDVSASFAGWHRASAGVPEALAKKVRDRVRIPLFAAMVALRPNLSVSAATGLDAFSVQGDDTLWFAGRTCSKPGYTPELESAGECWTLVSTPSYAVAEIGKDTMRDEKTGEFKPQTNEYLQSVPGPALLAAFDKAVMAKSGKPSLLAGEKPLYLQAQRWGSAFPAPVIPGDTATVLGTVYDRALPSLVPAADEINKVDDGNDFVADDDMRCYYAGDYCSHRTPGVEAAVLSALDAAEHIAAIFALK